MTEDYNTPDTSIRREHLQRLELVKAGKPLPVLPSGWQLNNMAIFLGTPLLLANGCTLDQIESFYY